MRTSSKLLLNGTDGLRRLSPVVLATLAFLYMVFELGPELDVRWLLLFAVYSTVMTLLVLFRGTGNG